MICKVRDTVTKYNMLKSGSVLVALSGGADSVSLLSVMLSLRDEFGIFVSAAHVNHMLRGEESERDELFVRNLCEELSVPLHVLRCDVAKEASECSEGIEEYGRKKRYAFFESLTDGEIATAHTLSDNLETVLLHLTRGSALNGLCGIPPVRGRFIRPLISCTREEIENYCDENGIEYVTDSTNKCNDYSRNRIRNLVIPELKKINPSVLSASLRCTESLTLDENFLSECAEKVFKEAKIGNGFCEKTVRDSHPAVRNRVLRMILCERMTAFPQKKHIELSEKVLMREFSSAELEKGVTLKNAGGTLYFEGEDRGDWEAEIVNGTARLPFGIAEIEIIHKDVQNYIQKINKQDLVNYFSCDKILFNLKFRNRRSGDRMKRANSSCTKSMKKLFAECSVPSYLRNDMAVLTSGGRIVWAEGIGCDDEFKLTEKTERIAHVIIQRDVKNGD